MSDSSDDELLRLAQYGDKGASRTKTASASRKRPASFDSDDEDGESTSVPEPYPLEGKYKDAEDRKRILAMSEIERESILYERDQEIVAIREKARLNARLKEQQAARQKQEAVKRKPTAQQSALSQLRKKREAKVNKRAYSSSEESDADADAEDELEEEAEYEEEIDEDRFRQDKSQRDSRDAAKAAAANDPTAREPIGYQEAIAIQVKRRQAIKFFHYPMYADAVRDCLVRVAIGNDVYRVCQIKAVVPAKRPYRLPEGEMCGSLLECAHAHSSKNFELIFLSDSTFTEQEYDHWRQGMEKDRLSVPRKFYYRQKKAELESMHAYNMTSKDIDVMLEAKRALQRKPGNPAQEKIRLKELVTEALERDDEERVKELQDELARVEELAASRSHAELDRMSKLNQRNRLKTTASVSKAEVAMARTAEAKTGSDPFSRFKTKPKTFYQSQPASLADAEDQSSQGNLLSSGSGLTENGTPSSSLPIVDSTDASQGKQKLTGVDQMVASIELDLDL